MQQIYPSCRLTLCKVIITFQKRFLEIDSCSTDFFLYVGNGYRAFYKSHRIIIIINRTSLLSQHHDFIK